MDWECPKYRLINPPSARFCDCGYDIVAQQIDRHRAPKQDSSIGWLATYRLLRLGVGGAVCGLFGLSLLLWELSESNPSAWGIARSVIISLFGFGLVGALVWLSVRSN